MELTEMPQVDTASGRVENPDAQALSLTGDTMADLQTVAKEMGIAVDANGNVMESAPPKPAEAAGEIPVRVDVPGKAPQMPAPGFPRNQQIAPAGEQPDPEAAAEAPAKFLNPDGTVDTQRLQKSTHSLDEAIAKYREKEREFHRLQNRVNNPQQGVLPQVQPQQPQAAIPAQHPARTTLSPLEIQMAQDIMAESQALGAPIPEAQAIAFARVQARGLEAKYAAEMSSTEDLRQRLEDAERTRELQGLIERDPSLLTPEMADTLWRVRQENPYLNNAREPWKAAYVHYLGTQTQGQTQQVKTPTPKGPTAPPAPVSPVARVQQTVDLTDMKALETLSTEQLEQLVRKTMPGYRGH